MSSVNDDNFDFYFHLTMMLGAYHFRNTRTNVTRDQFLELIQNNPNDQRIPSEACLDNPSQRLEHIIRLRSELLAYLRVRNKRGRSPTLVELMIKQHYLTLMADMKIEEDPINNQYSPDNLTYLSANPGFVCFIERTYDLDETGDPEELMSQYADVFYTKACQSLTTWAHRFLMIKYGYKTEVENYLAGISGAMTKDILMPFLYGSAAAGDLESFRRFRTEGVNLGFVPRRYSYDDHHIDDSCINRAAMGRHMNIINYMRECDVRISNSQIIRGLIEGGHGYDAQTFQSDTPDEDLGTYISHGDIELLNDFMIRFELTERDFRDDFDINHEDMFYYISLLLMSGIGQIYSKSQNIRQMSMRYDTMYGVTDLKNIPKVWSAIVEKLPTVFQTLGGIVLDWEIGDMVANQRNVVRR